MTALDDTEEGGRTDRAGSTASSGSAGKRDSTWAACCGGAALVLVVLLGLGAWGISELEKGLDGYGQVEKSANGPNGGPADPLAPGTSARYEDGLTVGMSEVRRERGSRVRHFTLTFDNGTDGTLRLGGTGGGGIHDVLDVRAGDAMDDTGPEDGSTSEWLDSERSFDKLRAPLEEDGSRIVPVRVTGDTTGMAITVEVTPQDDEYRDTLHWQLTLD